QKRADQKQTLVNGIIKNYDEMQSKNENKFGTKQQDIGEAIMKIFSALFIPETKEFLEKGAQGNNVLNTNGNQAYDADLVRAFGGCIQTTTTTTTTNKSEQQEPVFVYINKTLENKNDPEILNKINHLDSIPKGENVTQTQTVTYSNEKSMPTQYQRFSDNQGKINDEITDTNFILDNLWFIACHHGNSPNNGHYTYYYFDTRKKSWFYVNDNKVNEETNMNNKLNEIRTLAYITAPRVPSSST
ncbi:MAG: ubiquitin carboxyl-terminal hydrolase, partial [Candidatus Marinamargulisbacteria bacterium]